MGTDDNRLMTDGGFDAYLDIGKQDEPVDRVIGQEFDDSRIVGLIDALHSKPPGSFSVKLPGRLGGSRRA